MELKEAIKQLRTQDKRKFDQTVDLLVSLKGLDMRKDNVNAIATIPNKIKDKKICAFLPARSQLVDTITKPEFDKYKDKDALKELVDKYDFFIGHASLMPAVAATFGKALGPAGKMPSPQLGIVTSETPETIKSLIDKVSKSVKVRAKEPAIKIAAAKEKLTDEQIEENVVAIYQAILNALPNKAENIRKVMIKTTMGKPIAVEIK